MYNVKKHSNSITNAWNSPTEGSQGKRCGPKQMETSRIYKTKSKKLYWTLTDKVFPPRNKCRLTINLHTVVQVRKWRVSWGLGARLIVVQSVSSVTQSCLTLLTPWTAACQASLSIANSQSLLKLMSIESVMPSSHLILCQSSSPPAFNLSQHQGLFQEVSSSHQVAKVLEFPLQHQSFRWTPRTDPL